jgi:hypothetical protein
VNRRDTRVALLERSLRWLLRVEALADSSVACHAYLRVSDVSACRQSVIATTDRAEATSDSECCKHLHHRHLHTSTNAVAQVQRNATPDYSGSYLVTHSGG